MTNSRRLYRHDELARMLNPASLAIIGASARPGAFGERVLGNLQDYQGRIHLVNARYPAIGERPCHPSVLVLPESPDVAVITVAREVVDQVVEECIEAKVGGMIVFASGYNETGKPERAAQQARLAQRAQESGIPLIGPNCIGTVNFALRSRITFMPYAAMPPPRPGAIGIISQSGALGFGMEQAMHRGVSVSHVLTSGNSCDVDMADYVAYLADAPECGAIAMLFEGMADPTRLMRACEYALSRNKPVVTCKIAVGEFGASAAMSHTGSLAGSQAAYRAAFERAGVVLVDDFMALMETASFFAKAPAPKARGVAVLASSGGAAIMAADSAEAHGVALPQPEPAAKAVLEARIPEFGSTRNPVDVTAMVMNDPQCIPDCSEALMSDSTYGAMVVPTVFASAQAAARVPMFGELGLRHGKPVVNVWVSDWLEGPPSMDLETHPGIALFRSMDRAFATLAAWHRRAALIAAPRVAAVPLAAPGAKAKAAAMLAAAGRTLTERESKDALAAYGIPVVQERLVHSAAEAAEVAAALGFPSVLKVESPDLPHKTEAGVIRLNLKSPDEVRAAYDAVMANAARVTPAPRINGVLVQPMVPQGAEIMVGARVDPLFGPLIVVGLGGIFVELLKDTAVGLAPVTRPEALAMLGKLKGQAMLDGFRGAPAVDRAALAEVICRIGEFIADHQASVAEIDVNPLICAGNRILAVDALIVKGS
ncbi:MAG: CoA-binding protein [Rhodospirillales bacterium 70-18]|nr:acetate--CoA ligase family protein [Rhodospirillales bacterium]OJY76170.1 MAG: CoA-binding protein [Rhodospirillales bacterium 70-18]